MKRSNIFSHAWAGSLLLTISLGYAVSSGYVNLLMLLHDERVLQFTTQFFNVHSSDFYA